MSAGSCPIRHLLSEASRAKCSERNALNVNLFTLQPPQMATRKAMHLRATLTATGRVGEQNVLKNQHHDGK